MKRLILLFLMMFLLTGCAQSQPQGVPTEAPLEYRKTALTYDGIKDGWRVEFDNFTYSFAGLEPREEWDGMVAESRAIVQSLEERFGEIQGRRTLCMIYRPCEPFLKNNILYIGQDSFQTLDYAIGIAQMLYGNEANYGLLYALGSEIAQERGYPTEDTLSLEEALALCDTAPVYLDMNYACFLENYADKETLLKVKTLARAFFASLTEKEKANLLMNYSDEKYCRYLSRFLEANGKPAYDNADLGGTLFYNGGEEIRLVWENSDGVFYVEENFRENFEEKEHGADMLNSGYQNLRQLVTDFRLQADFLREKVGEYVTNRKHPNVVFQKGKTEKYGASGLFTSGNEIFLSLYEAFAHEYVHYLTQDTEANGWLGEVCANYLSYQPGDPRIAYGWVFDKTYSENLDPNNPEDAEAYAVLAAANAHLDHEFDWNSWEDYLYQMNIFVTAWDLFDQLTNSKRGIAEKVSFAYYLVDLAGEEAAMDALFNNAPEDIFGKNWDVLRADWESDLIAKYPWAEEIREGGRK